MLWFLAVIADGRQSGGTTDLTVAHIEGGCHEIELTCGHSDLGGIRMDNLLFQYVSARLREGPYVHEFCM